MMKRFGTTNNDFTKLYECYTTVMNGVQQTQVIQESQIEVTKSPSFPGANNVKIYKQRPGVGADLVYVGKTVTFQSDDGDGGTVGSASDIDKTLQFVTSKNSTQVKVVDQSGGVEEEFVTTVPVKFDSENYDIIIIHVEQI